ncbi:MAG TPA: UDP-N-acetylmuramoyl-L-alanyl-D-glutamate--2,6-diaminopimelate ligase [Candidatus Rubrimentiphilum sp.]|nr:UDP-N-acetylmuramoyl-L-alanyl-D-glutamate--2,6-diaminopimelate ligase [Candidatus Rubrimentiphilum sp.]
MIEAGVLLELLLEGLPDSRITGGGSVMVSSLSFDSRSVRPGALFFAIAGEHTDGHRYVSEAVARGATAVISEREIDLPPNVANVIVPDSVAALSKIADTFYRSPSRHLAVAGITGTNGKTTVTHMIAAIANSAGISAGIVGTLGTTFDGIDRPLVHTTPLASELQALLAQMRERAVKIVAMEVSSHALALGRVSDVHFAVAGLTNVTRDHLDFHETPEAYAAAKRRLFDLAERAVLNADDPHGALWAAELHGAKPVVTFGVENASDVQAENVRVHAGGSSFEVDGRKFDLHLTGRFNVSNALCAIAAARMLGIEDDVSARGLASVERVRGRMERIGGRDVAVIVDYAHTPGALESALRALREVAHGRRIVVFGCGGDRDRGKRREMGAAVAKNADYAYVTSDNPRTEDPRAIIEDILPGIAGAPHEVEPDRRRAIAAAIRNAQPGDTILIAGKGHETYQIVGNDVLPFDDAAEARSALAERERVPS